MRAWRGPHKVLPVFQDGRINVLDSVQKFHFDCLKPHQSEQLAFVTARADSGDSVVLMNPEPMLSTMTCLSHLIKLSNYFQGQPMCLCLRARRHWMDTRLRTRLRAGGSRMHYQQFDHSKSGTDVMLPIPLVPIDADKVDQEVLMPSSDQSISPTRQLPQIFSDHERARSPSPQLTASEKERSLLGTSAPLLTNPLLTAFLSNYPVWTTATQLPFKSASRDSDDPHPPAPVITSALSGAETAPSFKRRGEDNAKRERNGWFSREQERGIERRRQK